MVLAKVKKIGGGNFNGILEHGLSHHGGLGSCNCRFEQRFVTQTFCASVRRKNLRVDCLDCRGCEVSQLSLHDSRRNRSEFLLINFLAVAAAFSGLMAGRRGVRVMVPPSWMLTFTASPTFTHA